MTGMNSRTPPNSYHGTRCFTLPLGGSDAIASGEGFVVTIGDGVACPGFPSPRCPRPSRGEGDFYGCDPPGSGRGASLTGSFIPALGDSFGFLFASGGFSSNFSALNLPDISSLGLGWQLSPGGSTVSLNVVNAVPGGFDHDGRVDGSDFLSWQRNPAVGNLADCQANYGVSSLEASFAVPEPLSMLLLALLVGFCCGLHTKLQY